MSSLTASRAPFIAVASAFTSKGCLCFSQPRAIVAAQSLGDVLPALKTVREYTASGCWAVGFVAYEAAPAFDPALIVHPAPEGLPQVEDLPLVWFGIFDAPSDGSLDGEEFSCGEWIPNLGPLEYAAGFHKIKAAIADGETYQTNYTFRMEAPFSGDADAFGHDLISSSRARYAAYLDIGSHAIVSASPELFFETEGRRIAVQPMKGTARRGLWPDDDAARALWLRSSEKNRAENVMIVDLMRSDLGRIARTGSVRAVSLFDVEPLPSVWQMTSRIEAELRPGVDLEAIFAALFPCGSITGAPKPRTMALIKEIEPDPRGVYCGAVGVVRPGGDATFNVAIRTVTIDRAKGTATCGVGGGVTWDSDLDDELREAFSKAAFLTQRRPDFDLLETLRLENGDYWLLERHLRRLERSSEYFGRSFDPNGIRGSLQELADRHPVGAWRVRLLVDADGKARREIFPLGEPPKERPIVALAEGPVDASDPYLYHKTTHRRVYEEYRKAFPDHFDVLLWNPGCEATEFTIGNVVILQDGKKLTPPVRCGLLAGTARQELIERGEIEEAVLTPDEVLAAERVWLVNSVRGWVEVTFEES